MAWGGRGRPNRVPLPGKGQSVSSELGDTAQQCVVGAVFGQFRLLAVKAHLGEGARVLQRTHAEQALAVLDARAAAEETLRHLLDLERALEAARAEDENIRDARGRLQMPGQPVFDDQLAGGARTLRSGLADLRMHLHAPERCRVDSQAQREHDESCWGRPVPIRPAEGADEVDRAVGMGPWRRAVEQKRSRCSARTRQGALPPGPSLSADSLGASRGLAWTRARPTHRRISVSRTTRT